MIAKQLAQQFRLKITSAVALLAMFEGAASCAPDTRDRDWRNTSDVEIYYRATTGGRLAVFNLTRAFVYMEGSAYLERRDGRHHGHFAGPIELCSDTSYLCVRGGLYAVIPKDLKGQSEWSHDGVRCRLRSTAAHSTVLSVICSFRGKSTAFKYDQERGIVSYGETAGDEGEFRLVGTKGLLARDNR